MVAIAEGGSRPTLSRRGGLAEKAPLAVMKGDCKTKENEITQDLQ